MLFKECILLFKEVIHNITIDTIKLEKIKIKRMKKIKKKMKTKTTTSWTKILVVTLIMAIALTGTCSAKSLYLIADINADPTPIQSYDIVGNTVVYQTENGVPEWGGGAVGLAIDTDSAFLFITYEISNTIQLVDAISMADEGTTTAPGASNLAGIVVDQDKGKVYTVDRNTATLYIYSWNAATKTLTLDTTETLAGASSAHGIALDETNDLLYLGDLTKDVKVYSTSDWSHVRTFTVSQDVMGIAVDVANGFAYTGNAYPGYGSLGLLCKYDLNTNTETTFNLTAYSGGEDNVVGLAVDQSTGLLYITTGNQAVWGPGTDKLMAFDSNLNVLDQTGDIGGPTGICVPGREISYNPLNLNKDDGLNVCVDTGDDITYTISYENGNPTDVTGVTITDTLPTEVTYVSCTGGCSQSASTVTWNIGTLTPGQSGSVTLTVNVNSGTEGATIHNIATIDSGQTPQTTQGEYTVVCGGGIPVPEFGSMMAALAILLSAPAFAYLMVKK